MRRVAITECLYCYSVGKYVLKVKAEKTAYESDEDKARALKTMLVRLAFNAIEFESFKFVKLLTDTMKEFSTHGRRTNDSSFAKSILQHNLTVVTFLKTIVSLYDKMVSQLIRAPESRLRRVAIELLQNAKEDFTESAELILGFINSKKYSQAGILNAFEWALSRSVRDQVLLSSILKTNLFSNELLKQTKASLNSYLLSKVDGFKFEDAAKVKATKNSPSGYDKNSRKYEKGRGGYSTRGNYRNAKTLPKPAQKVTAYDQFMRKGAVKNEHAKNPTSSHYESNPFRDMITAIEKLVRESDLPDMTKEEILANREMCGYFNNRNACRNAKCKRKHLCLCCKGNHPLSECQVL